MNILVDTQIGVEANEDIKGDYIDEGIQYIQRSLYTAARRRN